MGYPGGMGGANTEAWHTVKMLRANGVEVHAMPTWGKSDIWKARLDSIGVPTHHVREAELERFELIWGSIVLGICNQNVYKNWGRLKKMRCKTVWMNCMTFMYGPERSAFVSKGMPDAMIFQSEFQRSEIERSLRRTKYRPETGHLVRGAFAIDEFPFAYQPRKPGDDFVVGRMARPAADKWSSKMWDVYGAITYPTRRALVMGVNEETRNRIGPTPQWAKTLAPQELPVTEYLRRIHCLVTLNGTARENWPRVGLEAMACGVPIVAPNRWGWKEMVRHEQTGFLADTDEELATYATMLAKDEELRNRTAGAARAWVEELTDPNVIWSQWERILTELSQG
jgi:glycosyltransferase involved in cell wall biosynthesis